MEAEPGDDPGKDGLPGGTSVLIFGGAGRGSEGRPAVNGRGIESAWGAFLLGIGWPTQK
jgi:hypothetical protein